MLLKRKKVKRNIEDEIRRLYFAQIKRINSPYRGEFVATTTSATKTTARAKIVARTFFLQNLSKKRSLSSVLKKEF